MNLGVASQLGLLAGLLGLSIASGVWARERYAPADRLPGLKVDGVPIPEDATLRGFVDGRVEALLARSVRLTVDGEDATPLADGRGPGEGGGPIRLSLRELGVTVDVEAVLARVSRLETEGDLLLRYQQAERARRGELD